MSTFPLHLMKKANKTLDFNQDKKTESSDVNAIGANSKGCYTFLSDNHFAKSCPRNKYKERKVRVSVGTLRGHMMIMLTLYKVNWMTCEVSQCSF